MPALLTGEVAFTTDTNDLYVGNSGNVRLTHPVLNAAGVQKANVHMVADKVTIPSGGSITVTLSGSAVFTSATSYICLASDITVKNRACQIIQVSGTQITFIANVGDVIQYFCIGN